MKVNLDTVTGYNIKNLSLQDIFKIINKKKVNLQKGYNKYKPHNSQCMNENPCTNK